MIKFSAQQIANYLHGEVIGDPTVEVDNVSKVEEGLPSTLSFIANTKYIHHIYTTQASIVLINRDLELKQTVAPTLIRVENAYSAMAMLLNLVEGARTPKKGVEPHSYIAASATCPASTYVGAFAYIDEQVVIGENVQIFPQVYIGENVRIGDNVVLKPGVKIYHDCVIGNNCTIHAGTVIGADGFGFAPQNGEYMKIAQIGNVVLEDDVEIGANTTIDRATMGSTRIRKGTKLDNLIQIAHNVEVGEHTVIAAQTGVAGSSKIGSNALLGGQVGISGHLTVGDGVMIGAQSGITNSVKAGSRIIGYPAMDGREWAKSQVLVKKLPQLYQTIKELTAEVNQLKKELGR